jgi:hypothetical protein
VTHAPAAVQQPVTQEALQATAFVPAHAKVPVHVSAAVQGVLGALASAEQPPQAFSAGALQATAFVPVHA